VSAICLVTFMRGYGCEMIWPSRFCKVETNELYSGIDSTLFVSDY
jgi:hypothetical protein